MHKDSNDTPPTDQTQTVSGYLSKGLIEELESLKSKGYQVQSINPINGSKLRDEEYIWVSVILSLKSE